MTINILFSFKKVEKHTILASQGGGGKCPLLPSPEDAHANGDPAGRDMHFSFGFFKAMNSSKWEIIVLHKPVRTNNVGIRFSFHN